MFCFCWILSLFLLPPCSVFARSSFCFCFHHDGGRRQRLRPAATTTTGGEGGYRRAHRGGTFWLGASLIHGCSPPTKSVSGQWWHMPKILVCLVALGCSGTPVAEPPPGDPGQLPGLAGCTIAAIDKTIMGQTYPLAGFTWAKEYLCLFSHQLIAHAENK